MPLLGTGFAPSLFALTLLALPPILINTYAAVRQVDSDVIDAARGMGMTPREITRGIVIPLALPVMFAGLRIAAIQVISGAVLAAYIGGGGLGDFITAGIAMMQVSLLLVGAVPATLLAIGTDLLMGRLQRSLTPPGLAMIRLAALVKRYPDARASGHRPSRPRRRRRRGLRADRPLGLRQDHDDADDQPADRAGLRNHRSGRPRRHAHGPGRAAPRHRLRDPAGRAVSAHDDRRERRDGAAPAAAGTTRGPRGASTSCSRLVGMEPSSFRDRYPRELSGGQRQRVGVARALAADPPVLLMDEPFGAIDPINRARLQDEFLKIQRQLRKTVVFVTHDIDEAIKVGDRIALLRDGRLVQHATPTEMLAHPADGFVEEFVGADRSLKRLSLIACGALARPGHVDGAPEIAAQTSARDALARMLESGARALNVEGGGVVRLEDFASRDA